jgi:hypothetical protein
VKAKPSPRRTAAQAEMELLLKIAERTKLSTDVLLGLAPMPTTVSLSVLKRETNRGGQLAYLVGCVIEALEFYDSDDGHNELVSAGVAAELKRIEGEYERATQEKSS